MYIGISSLEVSLTVSHKFKCTHLLTSNSASKNLILMHVHKGVPA